jgi:VCBS repeat-containing protein
MKNTPKSNEPIIERQVPPAGLQGAVPAPTPGAAAVRGAGAARKRKSELDALVASDQDEVREVNARDGRSEEVGELIAQASTPAPAPAPAVPVEPIGALPSSATGALMAAPTAAAGAAAVTTTAASSGGFSPILAGLGGLAALGGGGGGSSNSPATIGGVAAGAVFASSNTATPALVTASLTISDPDANQSVFAAVPSGNLVGAYGNFTFNSATGAWTYTVNNNLASVKALAFGQTASDSLTVTSVDGTATRIIVAVVNGSNDGPVANNDSGSTDEDTAVVINVLANDTDVDTGTVLVVTGASANNGTVTIGVGGALTYTPAANFNGTDQITYTISDGNGGTSTAVVNITIAAINDAASPITGQITGTTTESVNGAAAGTATGAVTVTDVDNTGFNTTLVSGPTNGTASITSAGVWTYTPSPTAFDSLNVGQTGTDSFIVQSADGTSTRTITVTINGQNDSATATNGTFSGTVAEQGGINNDTPSVPAVASGTVTFTDADSGNGVVAITSTSANGTFVVAAGGAWTYTVNQTSAAVQALNVASVPLTDTVTVTSADGSRTQVITVTINGANDSAGPITGQIDGTAFEAGGPIANQTAAIAATGTVAVADIDNTGFSTTLVTLPANGLASITAAGVWTYTPNATAFAALNVGQSATDSFVVQSADGTSSQIITVVVQGTNDNASITATGTAASANEAGGVGNASGGTNATATLGAVADTDAGQNVYEGFLGSPGANGYGSFSLLANGSWSYTVNQSSAAVQALNTNALKQTGLESLTDTIVAFSADGTASIQITATILGANDTAGPITGQISGTAFEAGGNANGTPAIAATGTVAVSDVDNTGFTAVAPTATNSGNGTYAITAGGAWTYTPNASAFASLNVGQSATDSFVVASFDGTSTQTITVVVQGTNDNASITAGGETASATESSGANNTTAGSPAIAGNTLGLVTDVDAGQAVYQGFLNVPGASGYGSFNLLANGTWSYTVNQNHATVQALNGGATLQSGFSNSLTDSVIVYTADGTAGTTIVATITGANDNATAIFGQANGVALAAGTAANSNNGNVNAAVAATGTITVADLDNTGFNVGSLGAGSGIYGTFAWASVGNTASWTYTPNTSAATNLGPNQQGYDSVLVTSSDGTMSQIISVTIQGANDAATIAGTTTGTVTEAGSALATAPAATIPAYTTGNGNVGTPSASGQLTVTDPDSGSTNFIPVAVGTPTNNGFGTYRIDADGIWMFALNNSHPAVQGLLGGVGAPTLTDSFVVFSSDATASQQVTITINGSNDAATGLAFNTVLSALEGGTATPALQGNNDLGRNASGWFTIDDVDHNDLASYDFGTPGALLPGEVNSVSGYGRFYANNATGAWGYRVDQTNATVQGLNFGQSTTDSFTYYSADGTASQLITVTIIGSNDAATAILGTAAGSVTEAGGASNGTTTGIAVSNTVTVTDVDANNGTLFSTTLVSGPANGVATITAAGLWTYTANTTAFEGLNTTGASGTDSFVVQSADGTSTRTITVTIIGRNDNASPITGTFSGTAYELGDAVGNGGANFDNGQNTYNSANGHPGTSVVGTVSVADVDNTGFNTTLAVGTTLGGTATIDAAGNWKYVVNNSNGTVAALTRGQSVNDTFTVQSADGTATQQITVTIQGANDAAAAIGGTAAGSVTEAGGASNGTTTGIAVSDIVTVSDIDTSHGTNFSTTLVSGPANGVATITAAGLWTYTANTTAFESLNAGSTLQAGYSAALTDSFVVQSADGTSTRTITVTVNGRNDDATAVTGNLTGTAIEAGTATGATLGGTSWNSNGGNLGAGATGTVTAVDVDNTGFVAVAVATASDKGFGTYTLDVNGNWVYTVNNGLAAVNSMNVGDTLTDTFTVTTADGTRTQLITVTIQGSNDLATFSATMTASVTEASGALNATPGTTATGTFTLTDADGKNPLSVGEVIAQTTVNSAYGVFSVDANGNWSYAVDNTLAAVQSLNTLATGQNATTGQPLTVAPTLIDTITVTTVSGQTTTLTVTINGANDNATAVTLLGTGVFNGNPSAPVAGQSLILTASTTSIQVLELASLNEKGYTGGPLSKDATGGILLPDADPLKTGSFVWDTPTLFTLSGSSTTNYYGAGFYNSDVAKGGTLANTYHTRTLVRGKLASADVDNFGLYVNTASVDATNGGTLDTTFYRLATTYGVFELYQSGEFFYAANNANKAVQALNSGSTLQSGYNATLVDTVTIKSADQTQSLILTFTINGQNDAALISTPTTTLNVYELYGKNNDTGGAGLIGSGPGKVGLGALVPLTPSKAANETGDNVVTQTVIVEDDDNKGFQIGSYEADYGRFVYDAVTNVWTYRLDNNLAAVQALNRDVAFGGNTNTLTDSAVVFSFDGTASTTLTVRIHGNNDAATIASGSTTGTVTERTYVALNTAVGAANDSVVVTASSTLTIVDVDNTTAFVAGITETGTDYGTWTFIDASGAWDFVADANAADSLNEWDGSQAAFGGSAASATLTATAYVTDIGGSTHQLSVSIRGKNDEADPIFGTGLTNIIAAGATSTVAVTNGANPTSAAGDLPVAGGTENADAIFAHAQESGGELNTALGSYATAAGTLSVADVDNTPNRFRFDATNTAFTNVVKNGTYGTITFNEATGAFSYAVNQTNTTVQALSDASATVVDTFGLVHSADGTSSRTLTMVIHGQDDFQTIARSTDPSAAYRTDAYETGDDVTNSATRAEGSKSAGNYQTPPVIPASGFYGYSDATFDGSTITYVAKDVDSTFGMLGAGLATTTIADATFNANKGWSVSVNNVIGGDNYGGAAKYTYGNSGGKTDDTFTFEYEVDKANTFVQALNLGESVTITFTVTTPDGKTSAASESITIYGANDTAGAISNDLSKLVLEGVDSSVATTTSGDITFVDPDKGQSDVYQNRITFVSSVLQGPAIANSTGAVTYTNTAGALATTSATMSSISTAHGKFEFNAANGQWTYAVDNANIEVQALNVGNSIVETFTVYSIDGTSSNSISVTIEGKNDSAGAIATVTSTAATEAGGVTNLTAALPGSGTVTVFDPDNSGAALFTVVPGGNSLLYAAGTAGGKYSVTAGGVWTYTPEAGAFDSLNATQSDTDIITITSADGTSTISVTVTISGANDNAGTITGDLSGTVVEASGSNNTTLGTPNVTGDVDVSDIDSGQNEKFQTTFEFKGATLTGGALFNSSSTTALTFTSVSRGAFTIDPDGNWSYTLDNTNAIVKALTATHEIEETYLVKSVDGTSSRIVTITIDGGNDDASGAATGAQTVATEAGGFNNGTSALSASGIVTVSDEDTKLGTLWTPVLVPANSVGDVNGNKGTYTINASGVWTYTPNSTAWESLSAGQSATDTFTVSSHDSKASVTVTVVINGANDDSSLVTLNNDNQKISEIGSANTTTGDVAANRNNGTAATITGTYTVSDVDNLGDSAKGSSGVKAVGLYGEVTFSNAVAGVNSTTGNWTYTITDKATTDSLNVGSSLADSVTIYAADGLSSQVLTVVIEGVNDAPYYTLANGLGTVSGGDGLTPGIPVSIDPSKFGAPIANTRQIRFDALFADVDTIDGAYTYSISTPAAFSTFISNIQAQTFDLNEVTADGQSFFFIATDTVSATSYTMNYTVAMTYP